MSTLTTAGITFGDTTSQTTAATAAALVTTTNVLNATAGASAGAVGTYAILGQTTSNIGITLGTTYAGSGLRYVGMISENSYGGNGLGYAIGSTITPSGTWRAVGRTPVTYFCTATFGAALFLRIS